jgi:hypothetical protein
MKTSTPTYSYLLIFKGEEFAGTILDACGFISLKVNTDMGKLTVCKGPSVTYVKFLGQI